MPFGKRNLIAGLDSATQPEILAPPPDATGFERWAFIWGCRKRFAILQIAATFVYHLAATIILSVAILFVSQDELTRFAAALTPYWPLLSRAQPYMDAHGHHELFLYMSAMYFKDGLLMAIFSLRYVYWLIAFVIQMRGKLTLDLQLKKAIGLLVPPTFIFWLSIYYDGPIQIPGRVFGRSVFDGDVFSGIIIPSFAATLFLLFTLLGPFFIFIPTDSDFSIEAARRRQTGEIS